MKQSSGIRGGLYAVSEWISKFALTNLQWTVFNLPVALLLLSLLNVGDIQELWYLLPPLVLLLPFIFFPATTAMFAKARDWVRKDHKETADRSYLSYYKENYKNSMKAGIVLTILWSVLAADLYYFSTTSSLLMNLFLILVILLFVYTINTFSTLVHFNLKVGAALKKSVYAYVCQSGVVFDGCHQFGIHSGCQSVHLPANHPDLHRIHHRLSRFLRLLQAIFKTE
ncbi:DUF624 domain-containing protein [Halobacillus litoralis]|uniref:YesL family protein n=1 Tax=Halobacillus litoralis TaxID=45668 RepID=UPI00273EDF31|nr:DUF624 domain-containing protein [Halobacillus litoralis]WLR48966.1 DUF624 domain-containing protein [Halobacillus litoralis]